ncbi:tetratricopeptide repeat protein [Methanoculleus sp. FWC-SCC1]|uniref:Tetratricopeptide repeat protein n=1 Tax=Methanoculleus frigidifontis TaxID=2584085 RepID=A0ABT8MDJ3_9EURY|nr:tetratricopeptide repeat protein [Methanoculleus sp. FWC-SCC1]MDN7026014.1 tetratricopeptide repeat protein [Methanoculleus sp. FWC-SCC1]
MVEIQISRYFETEDADECAELLVESECIDPAVAAEIRSTVKWVSVASADDGSLVLRLSASAMQNPALREELEGLVETLTEKERVLRSPAYRNNRLLDDLVSSLQGDKGELDAPDTGERSPSQFELDRILLSQAICSGEEVLEGHKWYDTILTNNPDDAVAWNAKGLDFVAKGEFKEAFACFTRALEIDPGYAQARYNRDHIPQMYYFE